MTRTEHDLRAALCASSAEDGSDHRATQIDRAALRAELAGLPRWQRAVLILRYYQGFSDPEIAAVLGFSSGIVRGYASRALAALRVEARTPETRRANRPDPTGSRTYRDGPAADRIVDWLI